MRQPKKLRDILLENQKAERSLAAMCGKPVRDDIAPIADKRKYSRVTPSDELEASVSREVGELLAKHPNVVFAVRQNSGMSQNAVGAPIWFYRFSKSKVKMRITDYWGLLANGRMFALECKRRNWTKPSGERESEQLNFILTVKNLGGRAGFVRSADEALEVLNG